MIQVWCTILHTFQIPIRKKIYSKVEIIIMTDQLRFAIIHRVDLCNRSFNQTEWHNYYFQITSGNFNTQLIIRNVKCSNHKS